METVYKCEICSKEFWQAEQCKNHEEKHRSVHHLAVDSAVYRAEDDVNAFPKHVWIVDTKDGAAVVYVREDK